MKKLIYVFILILISISIVSCNNAEEQELSLCVYSIKEDSDELFLRKIPAESLTTEQKINKIASELKRNEKGKFHSPLSGSAEISNWKLEEDVLYLEGLYYDVFASTRITASDYLSKAAVTNSFLSIEGVNHIAIVETDAEGNEKNYIMFDDHSFITDPSADMEIRYVVDLYYPDENRESLHKVTKAIPYQIEDSIYLTVLNALKDEPGVPGLIPSIPKDALVTDIDISFTTCFVSFDAESQKSFSNLDIPAILVGYSIINSLTSLEDIEVVCISAVGDETMFMNYFDQSLAYAFLEFSN